MTKKLVMTAVAVLMGLTAQARERQCFDKDWRFALGDSAIMAKADFDDSSWRLLDVPHDWAIEGDFYVGNPSGAGGGALPGGIGWYRKSFTVDGLQFTDDYTDGSDGFACKSSVRSALPLATAGTQELKPSARSKGALSSERTVNKKNLKGYEIHMGETSPFGDAKPSPLLHLSDGRKDGYIVDAKCMGTYVHGILDNSAFVDFLLQPFAEKLDKKENAFDYAAFKESQYDKLADHVRRHVDMERIYQILSEHD